MKAPDHPLLTLNAESLQAQLQDPTPCLVECFSKHCAPCARMRPILETLANRHQGRLRIVLVDLMDPANDALREQYAIRAVPTFLLFSSGAWLAQRSGACSEAELEAFVAQAFA